MPEPTPTYSFVIPKFLYHQQLNVIPNELIIDAYMIMYLSNYIVANPLQSYGYAYGLRLVLNPDCALDGLLQGQIASISSTSGYFDTHRDGDHDCVSK